MGDVMNFLFIIWNWRWNETSGDLGRFGNAGDASVRVSVVCYWAIVVANETSDIGADSNETIWIERVA